MHHATTRAADDDFRDVACCGVGENFARDTAAVDAFGAAAELLRERERGLQSFALLAGQVLGATGLHVQHRPRELAPIRGALAESYEPFGLHVGANANQDTTACRPRALDGARTHVTLQVRIDALHRYAHGKLAQDQQVAASEEILDGALCFFGNVHLAFVQPLGQLFGRKVDQLDFIGCLEHAVGQALAHFDTGNALDEIVETLEVLHIECCEHIDAGIQDLFDVLVTLFVATAGNIGVSELVYERELRLACQQRIEVELIEITAAILNATARQCRQAREKRVGLRPAVGLHDADDDVDALSSASLRDRKHLVRLADAGRGTEKDLQPSTALVPALGEQCIRRGSFFFHDVRLTSFSRSWKLLVQVEVEQQHVDTRRTEESELARLDVRSGQLPD